MLPFLNTSKLGSNCDEWLKTQMVCNFLTYLWDIHIFEQNISFSKL
jgi:hypothetical protein